jgi:hypothetical protein
MRIRYPTLILAGVTLLVLALTLPGTRCHDPVTPAPGSLFFSNRQGNGILTDLSGC